MKSIETTIHDLKVLKEYFEQESGGSVPACLPDAIELLEALKKIKEA